MKILKNTYSKNFIIYGIGQAFNLISPLLVIPYLVKTCGEEGFGKIGVGFSLAFIFVVIIDFSSYHTGIKNLVDFKNDLNKTKTLIVNHFFSKFFLFLFVVGCFGVLLLITYFRDQYALMLSTLMIVFAHIFNPNWIFQGQEDFLKSSVFNVSSKLFYLLGVFLFINSSEDFVYVPFIFGLGLLLTSVFYWVQLIKKYDINAIDFNTNAATLLIKKDYKLCLSQLLFAFRQYSPILIIDLLLGSFVAGQFKVIEQIVMVFRSLFQVLFRFAYSVVCNALAINKIEGIMLWKKINLSALAFVFISLVFLFCFSEQVLTFFNVSQDSDHILLIYQLALILPIFIGINLAFEQLMFGLDKLKQYINFTYGITLFSFLFLIYLTSYYELFGVITGLIIVELLLIVFYLKHLKSFILYRNDKET